MATNRETALAYVDGVQLTTKAAVRKAIAAQWAGGSRIELLSINPNKYGEKIGLFGFCQIVVAQPGAKGPWRYIAGISWTTDNGWKVTS